MVRHRHLDGREVLIEGVYQGHEIILRMLAQAPEDGEPVMLLDIGDTPTVPSRSTEGLSRREPATLEGASPLMSIILALTVTPENHHARPWRCFGGLRHVD